MSREACLVGSQTLDDLGIWCNYGQLHRDFVYFLKKGYWKKYLSEEEYKQIPWDKFENPDPARFRTFSRALLTAKANSAAAR